MPRYRPAAAVLTVMTAVACSVLAGVGQSPSRLPLEPAKTSGDSVTPSLEGWYQNPDGSFSILLGYYNRNQNQILDISIGPNNAIEPGGPDQGQPTHFLVGRQYGVFAITVPKDFGNKKLTWTLVSSGKTQSIPVWLSPRYVVNPFLNLANGNTPPVLRFAPEGPALQGPPRGIAASLSAAAAESVTLTLWAADKPPTVVFDPQRGAAGARGAGGTDALGAGRGGRGGAPPPAVTITWTKYRGPGDVTFSNPKPPVDEQADGKTTTTATFNLPGEYMLRATANDSSGEGDTGDQCCWTTAHVKITVHPGTGNLLVLALPVVGDVP